MLSPCPTKLDFALTLVPLLQLLLIEMGRLLKVGQLLLGKLALAAGLHYQRLVHKFNVLDGTARRNEVTAPDSMTLCRAW